MRKPFGYDSLPRQVFTTYALRHLLSLAAFALIIYHFVKWMSIINRKLTQFYRVQLDARAHGGSDDNAS